MKLQQFDALPEALLTCAATQLVDILGGPALLHLQGRQEQPLFVSVLMHGNETTGWDAVQALFNKYWVDGKLVLPRTLSLFIGNVSAAEKGVRRLEGQPDYNRVWPGSDTEGLEEHALMQSVVDIMRQRKPFASIDVHNNTGLNPHYACVNQLDEQFLHLATLFSRTVVYFIRPTGVQSLAMAEFCPAVTLECGRPDQPHGMSHALEYIDACLHLAQWPDHPVAEHDIELFHTVAILKVPEGVSFSFGEADTELSFAGDLDLLNFRELPRGTRLGAINSPAGLGLQVLDELGADVTENYLKRENGELLLHQPVMPSMLTKDAQVIRQDCFGYFMERYRGRKEK